jgi:Tfp pilus assembly protein PilN
MNDKNSLHFDFLLDEERFSSSQLRMRFIVPVLGVLCLLAPLVVWVQESSQMNGVGSRKQLLNVEIERVKPNYDLFLKSSAEEKELTAQLQQLGAYRKSKSVVGATLASLSNCVSSQIQLTELRLLTQTSAPFNGPQARPKNALELTKLCPTNQIEGMSLRLAGRSIQSGGNPAEVNRFLNALQGPAFSSLINQARKPKVSFQEEASSLSAHLGEGNQQEIVLFEIVYECLPRRFQ